MALSVTNAMLDGTPAGLRADQESGTILDIGPDVHPIDGDEVVDASGMALLPGLVNGHCHAAMTLFRSYASDLRLQEWLQDHIWPAEARLTDDHVYWGARLAAIEMLRSGTTHVFDMYWRPTATARACEDAGIRATIGAPLFDFGNADNLGALQDSARRSIEDLAGFGPLIEGHLAPHSIYMVSEPSLRWVADFAAENGLIVHIHFCESLREVEDWMSAHEESPTAFLDRLSLLGERTLLAHGCVVDRVDYEMIGARGATIVTNPVSNLKLASGRIFPFRMAAGAGVRIGLGTDGASSNNSLDLLSDLKTFAIIEKHEAQDPSALPAAEALAIAQGRRSPLLGGAGLEVGERADFVLVDTTLPELNPGDLTSNLVYAASGAVVDTTVVAGQVRMRHRHIDGVDEVIREANRCASELLGT